MVAQEGARGQGRGGRGGRSGGAVTPGPRPFRLWPQAPGLWPLAVLGAAAVVYHLPALVLGIVPTQDDVEIFYFPLLVATAEALQQGQIRLWTPLIFGGYPLFADGEAGMLYPINLLFLPWMVPEQALVFLRIVHSALASVFTLVLLRVLGVGVFGGLVAGLAFAYSGFAAGQIVHASVARSMVWLPLELAFAEQMCRAQGAARLRYATFAGAVFGIQALALHIHVTLLSALLVSAFVGYRWVAAFRRTDPRPQLTLRYWLSDGLSLALALTLVGALGVGLAAVQLLPLQELAGHTYRGEGLPSALSIPNSVWPGNLLTLLLPHIFDVGTRDYWGAWVKWETVLYVGLMPLVLAALGLVVNSGRHRPFFVGVAVFSILAAFGPQGPIPLWDTLHALPGFNVLQSPGRFSLLFSLAVAVLAGYGGDWLARHPVQPRASALVVLGTAGAVAGSAVLLADTSARLERWSATGSIIIEEYLRTHGVPYAVGGIPLTMARAAEMLSSALSPGNPVTAWQLGLALGAGLCIALWLLGSAWRPVAALATVGILFIDLWVTALTFHPYSSIGELRPRVPAILQASELGQSRVLTNPTAGEKTTEVDPNRLMAAGIEEAGGYSSLAPDRSNSYLHYVLHGDDELLNAWNVRYLVRQNRPDPFPHYEQVSFHPTRPILQGKDGDRGRRLTFLPDGGPAIAHELRIVSALNGAERVPDGTEVARLTLKITDGETRAYSLLAGRDVSDAALEVPGAGPFAHRAAEVAFDHQQANPLGDNYMEQIYYSRFAVSPSVVLDWLEVEQTTPQGRLKVHGIGAYDPATREVTQVWNRQDRPVVYRDAEITIRENLGTLPRAYLVPEAITLPPEADILERMHYGPFDPRRTVVLEEALPVGYDRMSATAAPDGAIGTARVLHYGAERVVVSTDATRPAMLVLADAYFPGWVARVDGQLTTVLQANYLLRAVPVPAGRHEVTFSYEPPILATGLAISLASTAAVGALLLALSWPRRGKWL